MRSFYKSSTHFGVARIVSFWKDVFSTLSEISGIQIEPDPLTALFGVSSPTLQLSKARKDVIAFITLLARWLILFCWKSSDPPSHAYWIKEALCCMKLENIRHRLKGLTIKFSTDWAPFISLQFQNDVMMYTCICVYVCM